MAKSPRTSVQTAAELSRTLQNAAIFPLECAASSFDWVNGLFKAVERIATLDGSDATSARNALAHIKTLAALGDYLSLDQGNTIDAAREQFEKVHLPDILAFLQGGEQ